MWILLVSAPAWAGGYFYSDAGIVATGRGGAWVAGADTQFAQYYNPAGLIRIGGPTINVGASGVQQNVGFTRQGIDEEGNPFQFEEARNQAAPFAIPQIGFATPLGRRVALAFGFYSPFAPSAEYDEEGPQRYSVKDTLIYQFSVGPSAAVRVADWLTVGLGLQWKYLQVGQSLDIVTPGFRTLAGANPPESAEDIAVDARVVDLFTPSFNAGLLIEPVDALSIGLAVQPPARFEARGEGSLDFDGHVLSEPLGWIDQTLYDDDDIALNLQLPLVLRGGIAVRPRPNFEIEAAVVYQGWSSTDDLLIEDIDIELDSDILDEELRRVDDTISLPAGFRDTWSYRLGAEWRATDVLELRAGGFFETGALVPSGVSVALVDTSKWQLGGGGTLHLIDDRLRIDFAGAFLQFPNLQIRDSTVTQISAGVELGEEGPQTVGNGDLRANGWVLGLQAQWNLKGASNRGRTD